MSGLYSTKAWLEMRSDQLSKEPMCKMCAEIGKITVARVADHIKPHKGDKRLFYDANNLQSLCKQCHDRHKQRQEKTGIIIGHDINGFPIDPNHHWNKGMGG